MITPKKIEIIHGTDVSSKDTNGFLDAIVVIEKSAWNAELHATHQKFRSRLEIFPKGFIAIKVDGTIKAFTTSQICTYDPLDSENHTWNEFTDSGMIKKTHQPNGNALYVVSVAVAKDAQNMGLGKKLVQEQQKLARSLHLKYLFLGARIPGYDSYTKNHEKIPVEKYLKLKNENNEPLDPEIRFYERQGLKPVKIIPHFEPDRESHDYGVLMIYIIMMWQVTHE